MSFQTRPTLIRSMSAELVWTIWHSLVGTGVNLRRGKSDSQNWTSAMVESSMLITALRSLAEIRTTLPWSSLLRSFSWPALSRCSGQFHVGVRAEIGCRSNHLEAAIQTPNGMMQMTAIQGEDGHVVVQ